MCKELMLFKNDVRLLRCSFSLALDINTCFGANFGKESCHLVFMHSFGRENAGLAKLQYVWRSFMFSLSSPPLGLFISASIFRDWSVEMHRVGYASTEDFV